MRARAAALCALLALAACESSTDPKVAAVLSLQITQTTAQVVDGGTLHVEGPTPSTRSLSPGETVEVKNLQPGSYTVSLEARASGALVEFARTTVGVVAGQTSTAVLNLASFVPDFVNAPNQVTQGASFSIQIDPVSNANGYRVEWDDDSGFGSPQSAEVSTTGATLTINEPGVHYVRASARSPFGTLGLASAPATVQVNAGVGSVEVAPASNQLLVGQTVQLQATVRDTGGNELTGKTVTWSSDDESVATVSATGLVEAKAEGRAIITAETEGVQGMATVDVVNPPMITRFDTEFRPFITGCGPGALGFRVAGEADYSDADGNVSTSGPLTEPTGVQSEFRFEDQADWVALDGRSWAFTPASDGGSGTLVEQSTLCYGDPGDLTFIDFRIRIQDGTGAWSEWFESRLMLPATVVLQPMNTLDLSAQGAGLVQAVAYDASGDQVPGDPINWGSYVGSGLGSIDADGLYTLTGGASGVDRIFARAGAAWSDIGMLGPGAGNQDSWWAPCWSFTGLGRTAGNFIYLKMRVFAGREYQFTLAQTAGSTATGDPDLYIRMTDKPTIAVSDASSLTSGFDESIVWTAPADGVVWIGIYAFADYTNVTFAATTTDGNCGYPALETSAPGAPAMSVPAPEIRGGGTSAPALRIPRPFDTLEFDGLAMPPGGEVANGGPARVKRLPGTR